jgi:hypothetical protein
MKILLQVYRRLNRDCAPDGVKYATFGKGREKQVERQTTGYSEFPKGAQAPEA